GTFTMAVMPPFSSIGLAAPLLVLVARLIQGFAVGREFRSATVFLVEPRGGRGVVFHGAWMCGSQGLPAITAAAFGSLLTAWLPAEHLNSWGWRVPFVFGLLVGPVGYYIRSHLDETPEFLALREQRAAREAAGEHKVV